MKLPSIIRQGVIMGWFRKKRDWMRLIILGVGLAVIAGQIGGCQSSVKIDPAKSEASSQTNTTRLGIKTPQAPTPAPVRVRVQVKEAK